MFSLCLLQPRIFYFFSVLLFVAWHNLIIFGSFLAESQIMLTFHVAGWESVLHYISKSIHYEISILLDSLI